MAFTTVRPPLHGGGSLYLRVFGRTVLSLLHQRGRQRLSRTLLEDLIHWTEHGLALSAKDGRWANDTFWAPECYELGGKYVLLYSANWKDNPTQALENYRIGAAVADTPVGPFAEVSDRPIFDPGYPIIDANLYQEEDRYYLYYSRCCYEHNVDGLEESWIYGGAEARPQRRHRGAGRCSCAPRQPWEGRSAAATGRRWNEGSFLMKAGTAI